MIWWVLWAMMLLFVPVTEAQVNSSGGKDSLKLPSKYPVTHYESPGRALLLSAANTIVPAIAGGLILGGTTNNSSQALRISAGVIMAYGLLIGPAMGLHYAGSDRTALKGILARTAAAGIGLFGVAEDYQDFASKRGNPAFSSLVLIFAGGAILVGSDVLQIVQAPLEARKYNHSLHLSMAPVWYPKEKAPGLAVRLRF